MTACLFAAPSSRGVFAGIALKGSTLRADRGENEVLYGQGLDTRDVVNGKVPATREGRSLIAALTNDSPAEKH